MMELSGPYRERVRYKIQTSPRGVTQERIHPNNSDTAWPKWPHQAGGINQPLALALQDQYKKAHISKDD